MDEALIDLAVAKLLDWYRETARSLPWREEPTPYHVWISEIMLQQTRVEAVIPYYHRFLAALPDVAALAAVEEDKLMKLWEGLGYYSRARNLKRAAGVIMEKWGGELPQSPAELEKIPGIGAYTAGAIASIAYGRPAPAVDGNVLRVMARLTGDRRDVLNAATRKDVTALLSRHYPAPGPDCRGLTQALMELGQVLCLPKGAVKCERCPWATFCRAHLEGLTDEIPYRCPPKPRRIVKKTVLLLCHGPYIALRKRPEQGLLAGLWELPNCEGHLTQESVRAYASAAALAPRMIVSLTPAVHIFTHLEWHMAGYMVDCGTMTEEFTWATVEELQQVYALPGAFRPFVK